MFGYRFESSHQFCEHFHPSATSVHQVDSFHVRAFAPASIIVRSQACNRTQGKTSIMFIKLTFRVTRCHLLLHMHEKVFDALQ